MLTFTILLCSSTILSSLAQKSTLKVAVCNPGQMPYAFMDLSGNLTGYDVGKKPNLLASTLR